MTGRWMIAAAMGLVLAASAAQAAAPPHIAAALADTGRPADDRARDPARKPGEMLALTGLKPGDKVADLFAGAGYFTRIAALAVGPKGQVWAFQPAPIVAARANYGEDVKRVAAAHANVTPLITPFDAMGLPAGLDMVMSMQSYHDLHQDVFPADTAAVLNAQVFRALKPGGVYLVADHVALAGASRESQNTLHRADLASVRAEVEAAGFRLETESPLLRTAGDDHRVNVFDPKIRGRTDQFVLVFRKPA